MPLKKIAVLLGGKSAERAISIKTGMAVFNALKGLGYQVDKFDTNEEFIFDLKRFNPDLVFIALHGSLGEDGTIQGMMEVLGYPYTGCNVLTSALSMNKIYTKRLLKSADILTPQFTVVQEKAYIENPKNVVSKLAEEFSFPLAIKAPSQGSSIGIYFANTNQEIHSMLAEAFKLEKEILIEEFIKGKEVTVSIIGNNDLQILPIIEIISHTGDVFDYAAKYTKGLSEHIIPARLDNDVAQRVNEIAKQSYTLLGCKGFARVDFIIENEQLPYVLEINTIPGMTETSLLPEAANSSGISFTELIQSIIEYALEE